MRQFIANNADSSGKEGIEVYLTKVSSKRICLTISSGESHEITTLNKDGVRDLINTLQYVYSKMTNED